MFSDQNQPVMSCHWHVSQSRRGALLMPQGKCRRQGLWPRPHCVPPTLGGHHWEVARCKEANNSSLNLGLGRDPRPSSAYKGAPIHLGPHIPGVVLLEDPPRIPDRTLRPAVHPQAFLWLLETSLGKTISRWRCERSARDQTERGEKRPHAHRLCLWGISHRPHLHLLELEVLLGRQLRAAVRGARGLGLAVSFPEIDVDPQPKVTVLSSHTLRREVCQTPRPTPALRPQGHAEANATFFFFF